MKKGEKVLIVMERYNPQLGMYCTIDEGEVVKVLKNTVVVSNGFGERKFDVNGCEKNPTRSVYGSATYHVYGQSEAKALYDGEKRFNGIRISYGEKYLQNVCNY